MNSMCWTWLNVDDRCKSVVKYIGMVQPLILLLERQ